MPIRSEFGYAAEIRPEAASAPTEVVELGADWEPALQWSYFQTVRAGTRSPVARCLDGTVEPVWDAALGQPSVAAFRIRPGRPRRGSSESFEIPSRYLRPVVETAASGLVQAGRLTAGDLYRFRIIARPERERGARVHRDFATDIQAETIAQPLSIRDGSLSALLETSAEHDREHADPIDLPVMLSADVLDQAVALAGVAPELETGGVLLGALRRDVVSGELFLEVSALLPARHAISQPDRLTFTHDTWADARAAIELRAGGEDWVGWFHTHPFFCRGCSPEAQRECVFTHPFLSDHDRSLHRTVFGRAFDVALLLTDRGPVGHRWAMFGWRRGMLERRAFHVIGEQAPTAAIPSPVHLNEDSDGGPLTLGETEPRRSCGERDADAPA